MARFALISQFTGEVVFFVLLGLWIDFRWETSPWALIVCVAVGFAVSLYQLIRNVAPPRQ